MHQKRLIIFSDLDGCLLNKHDYDWRAAELCLKRLVSLEIPVVIATSKTSAEIECLVAELPMIPAPFIAENGGTIHWGPLRSDQRPEFECAGIARQKILKILAGLTSTYRFRSFETLGCAGVMEQTDLSESQAQLALRRQSTEPLLWEDTDENLEQFQTILRQNHLTLTKGGRFWHVAGHTSKGEALKRVAAAYNDADATLVAIGDSPIDQSMLDLVDIPVGIRVAGNLGVSLSTPPGIVPESEGAAGWAEAVTEILDRIK
jgi:mannosyl-3-phosphoglycerate phosphatase